MRGRRWVPPSPAMPAGLDFRLAELRVAAGDHEIAAHRELVAGAERDAVDRGDHRLGELLDHAPRIDAQRVVDDGHDAALAHVLEIRAGREGLLVAGDDDGADIGIVACASLSRRASSSTIAIAERVALGLAVKRMSSTCGAARSL